MSGILHTSLVCLPLLNSRATVLDLTCIGSSFECNVRVGPLRVDWSNHVTRNHSFFVNSFVRGISTLLLGACQTAARSSSLLVTSSTHRTLKSFSVAAFGVACVRSHCYSNPSYNRSAQNACLAPRQPVTMISFSHWSTFSNLLNFANLSELSEFDSISHGLSIFLMLPIWISLAPLSLFVTILTAFLETFSCYRTLFPSSSASTSLSCLIYQRLSKFGSY